MNQVVCFYRSGVTAGALLLWEAGGNTSERNTDWGILLEDESCSKLSKHSKHAEQGYRFFEKIYVNEQRKALLYTKEKSTDIK